MTAEVGSREGAARMGPFVVSRVLGRGGMGIVYAGTHEHTGAEVAIKTVSAGSAPFMAHVRHEASTLSRIRHPGVVQILGVGVDAGLPWYAMELLAGGTLGDLLGTGALGGGGTHDPAWTGAATSDWLAAGATPSEREVLTRLLADRAGGATVVQVLRGLAGATGAREVGGEAGAITVRAGAPGPAGAGPSGSVGAPSTPAGSRPLRVIGAGLPAVALPRGAVPRSPIACDLQRVLPIMRGVCDALAFVHGEGVVHRDLKPENIFIRTGDVPVLVDFGLATHVGADGRDVLHAVGGVAGSLGYMAPEQLRGELLDARCDLYALGCILYRAVTGRLPFDGPTWRVIAGHLMDAPAPPGQLVLGLPAVLDDLITGLLAKDRDHRIGSAEAADAVLAEIGGAPCRWPSPPPPAQPFLYRPPFVGRQDVLAQLADRLHALGAPPREARAPADRGGLVLIGGESGAGKTRLVLEAVKLCAEARATTVTCACTAGGGPLEALREVFRALVDHSVASAAAAPAVDAAGAVTGTSTPEGLAAALAAAAASASGAPPPTPAGPPGSPLSRLWGAGAAAAAVLAMYSPELAELPGVAALPEPELLPAPAARARVFRCLSETLSAFTRDAPLLLVIDDIHLADSFTLGFLTHVLDQRAQPGAPRMLVVGCYRSEERGPALDALAARAEVESFTLERMTEREVGQMVQGMLALPDPPRAFVAFLARESGGNPFFVAEYLRMAVAERALVRDRRGSWRLADASAPTEAICEALPLPRSLRQVVELRLGKLAPQTRAVLDAAAVIGRRFTSELLRAVVALPDRAQLEALDAMVAAQVIEPLDAASYRFVHDKLHELPAAALEAGHRRALHARVAEAMEAAAAAAVGEAPYDDATIGRHWAAAGLPERAAPRLHAAGDRARRIHAVDSAIELYRAARDAAALALGGAAAGGSAPWRDLARELDEKLGDALAFSSQHASARAAFRAALAGGHVDSPGRAGEGAPPAELIARARLLRKIAKTLESEHAYPDALAGYAELEALISPWVDPASGGAPAPGAEPAAPLQAEWVQAMLGRAWIYYWSGRVDEMSSVIERVRPLIATRGTPLDRYRFYLALVTRDYRRDRYRISGQTLEDGRACVAAAEAAGSIGELAFARFVRGFGLVFARQLIDAEVEISAGLGAARKIGDAVAETRAVAYLGLVHRLRGHVDEVERTAAAALAMARARKMGDYEGMSLALLGWVARERGDAARAEDLGRQAIATWSAMAYPFPFRWLGALLVIEQALAQASGPAPRIASPRELAKLAGELTALTQHHLPDPLDEALRAAAEHGERGDDLAAEEHLHRAVQLAHDHGYL